MTVDAPRRVAATLTAVIADVRARCRTAAPPLTAHAAMRWSVVEAIVDGLSPATILEIGCGQGGFGARLARRGVYLGVEPDPLSCGTAVRRIAPLGGEVRNVSWSDIEPGRTFDLVCAFEVLEHLDDDQATLEAWRTLISPGGS